MSAVSAGRRACSRCDGRAPRAAPSARVCRGSTAGRRSPAPSASAPTTRPPMRCGCAWCARRMPARASRSATSTRSSARTPGLVAILTAARRAGRERLRHLPEHQGPAGACAEATCASAARRCWRWSARARPSSACRDAELPIAWDAAAAAVTASRRRWRRARRCCTPHVPDNVLVRGHLQLRRRRGGARARGRSTRRGHASRPPSSSTPTSSPRPATRQSASGDRIEVAACTQAPYMDREETARVLGVDADARAHHARRPAAAASAASSTCRCSRCWRSPRG